MQLESLPFRSAKMKYRFRSNDNSGVWRVARCVHSLPAGGPNILAGVWRDFTNPMGHRLDSSGTTFFPGPSCSVAQRGLNTSIEVATRYDKTDQSRRAMIHLAATALALR